MTFTYSIPSRTTWYDGVEFRSELEAAWAAYFKLRGVPYEYEPLVGFDFWRPDFQIKLTCYEDFGGEDKYWTEDVLVEVKPYTQEQWHKDTETMNKTLKAKAKIFLAGIDYSVFLTNFGYNFFGFAGGNTRGEDPEDNWKTAKNTVRWKKNVS